MTTKSVVISKGMLVVACVSSFLLDSSSSVDLSEESESSRSETTHDVDESQTLLGFIQEVNQEGQIASVDTSVGTLEVPFDKLIVLATGNPVKKYNDFGEACHDLLPEIIANLAVMASNAEQRSTAVLSVLADTAMRVVTMRKPVSAGR
jgi:hypothetical protein